MKSPSHSCRIFHPYPTSYQVLTIYVSSKYTLEYRLCVKQGCILCAKIGSGVRTPDISTKGKNIRGELLQWMELLVVDPLDKAHLSLIDETRAYIDKITPSLEELMSNLPSVKEDKITNKSLAKGNYKDK